MRATIQTIFENEFITLMLHQDGPIVHHKVHKFVDGETLRQALTTGVDLLRRHGCSKWLSDDRFNGAVTQADTEWSQQVWFPEALAAGWKYWALVLPENVLGQMSMRRFIEPYAARGVTVRVLDDPNLGLRWLRSQ